LEPKAFMNRKLADILSDDDPDSIQHGEEEE
jgi:hypothetical protein